VAYLIYKLLVLTRETRAMQVLKGAGILLIAIILANWFKLTAISWLLNQAILAGSIALVVIFQPELRRALEQIGRGKFFKNTALFRTSNGGVCRRTCGLDAQPFGRRRWAR
jgi:diadenylate cyclase